MSEEEDERDEPYLGEEDGDSEEQELAEDMEEDIDAAELEDHEDHSIAEALQAVLEEGDDAFEEGEREEEEEPEGEGEVEGEGDYEDPVVKEMLIDVAAISNDELSPDEMTAALHR